jgi:protein-tyrosine kinase
MLSLTIRALKTTLSSGDNVSIIEKAAGRLELRASETLPVLDARITPPFEHKIQHINARAEINPGKKIVNKVEINLATLQKRGMIVPEQSFPSAQSQTLVTQEFSGIKRALIRNTISQRAMKIRNGNLIMITSALSGEGKTFCAINLAMSMAKEMDHTVLLVDADVAQPSVLRTLDLAPPPGLMDLLLDEKLDLADVMLKTNVDTLSILSAGASHRNASELLASLAMSNLLNEISSRYSDRIVIFDSPPLLRTTEAHVLAGQMGQIVMVVEAENTTQEAVKNALLQIKSYSNVSLIYNKAEPFLDSENYGYGHCNLIVLQR